MSADRSQEQPSRHANGNPASLSLKEDRSLNNSEDQNATELTAKAREQEREASLLRRQVTQAYIKEMQLLNDKYALERKFSDLRMAMEEKQKETISSALKDIADRRGDLNEYLRLTNDLKDVEDERYIFMTSLLGLLAEHGIWPSVTNASSISMYVKNVYDVLQWKLQEKTKELSSIHGINGVNQYYEDSSQPSSVNIQSPYTPMRGPEMTPPRYYKAEEHLTTSNNMSQYGQNEYGNDIGQLMLNDEGPGIEGFQIIGEAKPGCKLLGCGYPVRGTSLCIFQWLRHLQDGTRHYIEGATNPEYVVTADDVDKYIAVECIPMDENGRQGEIVRLFANDQNKITCDPEMQEEINSYISQGQAHFSVLVLFGSLEHWEAATFILHRSGFQVKNNETEAVQIAEKFSENLSIKIPGGLSAQFVVTCSDGTSHPFKTYNDLRMRDTIVLTIRMFQSKALERGKGKAQL
ncbi:hypothetical protein RND81_02G101600 [Saponaria officinalis]|uniref:Uncharacterized protein n=1 Tax=Saponaria officinalis TaxID=3572 RepID=A0AAW1MUG1_SAPOF